MSAPTTAPTGPCDWPLDFQGCNDEDVALLSGPDAEGIRRMAVEYLWNWTGRRFGACEVTVRPCRRTCFGSTFWGTLGSGGRGPVVSGTVRVTEPSPGEHQVVLDSTGVSEVVEAGCGCNSGCCHPSRSTLRLPGPVASIESVVIDGKVLDPSHYHVDNHMLLVRHDGLAWPDCQALDLPATEQGTFAVTYRRGYAVPPGGQIAAGRLAVEFALALCNSSRCQLPQRVQTVTRQGVTVALLDGFDDLGQGRTGIWLIDSWVSSIVNTPRASTVRSVDVPHPRNRSTTWQPSI